MSKHKKLGIDGALSSLRVLIGQTHDAIETYRKRGDSAGLSKLIFQQRHNLKVLFKNLELAKKGKK